MRKVGYTRTSINFDDCDVQLGIIGVELDTIIKEKSKHILNHVIDYLEDGDVLYVSSLDRIARDIDKTIEIINEIVEKGIDIYSQRDKIFINSRVNKFDLLSGKYKTNKE